MPTYGPQSNEIDLAKYLYLETFKKNPDPGWKVFLKALGVLAATIFGVGIGGYFAYKHFFSKTKEEKTSTDPNELITLKPK